MKQAWERFWLTPATPRGLVAARLILVANTLWILASRPNLPDVLTWPQELWAGVRPTTLIRYGYGFLPIIAERGLWITTFLALAFALVGVFTRTACFVAALLLYHFAPLENVLFSRMGPYFNGLTLPILGLFIIAFTAPVRRGDIPSPDFRWPVALIQILFMFNYFFSLLAKLQSGGWQWMSSENIRQMLIASVTYEPTTRPLAYWIIGSPALALFTAIFAFVVDALFIVVPFSRVARRVLVPVALAGHIMIVLTLGIIFLSAPYLLLYINWDWVFERTRDRVARH